MGETHSLSYVLSESDRCGYWFHYQVSAPGLFVRGSSFDSSTGRFTADVSGVYQFHANLHISWHLQGARPTSGINSQTAPHVLIYIRALICINSRCAMNG